MKISIKNKLNSTLLMFVVCGASSVAAFDPDAALKQERRNKTEEQRIEIERWMAENEQKDRATYERYRNKKQARINDNGTVTFGELQWMRCSLGQKLNPGGDSCRGKASMHNRDDAMALPGLMNRQGGFAGYTDWRLPSFAELSTIRACSSSRAVGPEPLPGGRSTFSGCSGTFSSPTIDISLFPDTPKVLYWTSSHVEGFKGFFALVDFSDGSVLRITSNTPKGSVRLVRTIQ